MPISFQRATRHFHLAIEDAQRSSFESSIGGTITPKEQVAALRAALELMGEAASTTAEKKQVKEARSMLALYRLPMHPNPVGAAVDAMNMNGRKNRIKKRMIKEGL